MKAEIEYNVANRPLLVEMQTQGFSANMQEMREVENFVQLLREAQLDPSEHLNQRQQELLASAEFLERLNASTAYFPTKPQMAMVEEQDADLEGEEEEEDQEEEEVAPVEEVNEGEEHDGEEESPADMIEVEDDEGEMPEDE